MKGVLRFSLVVTAVLALAQLPDASVAQQQRSLLEGQTLKEPSFGTLAPIPRTATPQPATPTQATPAPAAPTQAPAPTPPGGGMMGDVGPWGAPTPYGGQQGVLTGTPAKERTTGFSLLGPQDTKTLESTANFLKFLRTLPSEYLVEAMAGKNAECPPGSGCRCDILAKLMEKAKEALAEKEKGGNKGLETHQVKSAFTINLCTGGGIQNLLSALGPLFDPNLIAQWGVDLACQQAENLISQGINIVSDEFKKQLGFNATAITDALSNPAGTFYNYFPYQFPPGLGIRNTTDFKKETFFEGIKSYDYEGTTINVPTIKIRDLSGKTDYYSPWSESHKPFEKKSPPTAPTTPKK